jgi:hypothetical protein
VTLLAYSRPFWPLFLHVLGAMLLFGAALAAFVAGAAGHGRAAFRSLLVAIPFWALMLGAGSWLNSDADGVWNGQTWLQLGMNIAGPGVLALLVAIGTAYWWTRSGNAKVGRVSTGVTGIYILLLAVAWLAMSGKWG